MRAREAPAGLAALFAHATTVLRAATMARRAGSGSDRTRGAASDGAAVRFPVSAKGVLVRDGRVLLVKNRRDEWELPGGKLEAGETPSECVAREIAEELGLVATVGPILDAWVYRVRRGVDVLVVAYGCNVSAWPDRVTSPEGCPVAFHAVASLDAIPLPAGYHAAIRSWAARAAP
jgi:8-oxo-dGTP pyrophosphatase MutT (NUDIX family)